MNTKTHPTTLEELLKFVYNVETEGDIKLLPGNWAVPEEGNAVLVPIDIFNTMVKDFECYRAEIEEKLSQYEGVEPNEFVAYIREKLAFVPMVLWSEAGMLVTPFTKTAPAQVKEASMEPAPAIESNRKIINLLTHHLREVRETKKEHEELERDKQKFKNPTIHMAGGTWLVVREDGKNCSITDDLGNEFLTDGIVLSPLEYQLALTCAKLERQVLHLREKYEPQDIDWDKEPSHGISQWAYEGPKVNPVLVALDRYVQWRADFSVFAYDLEVHHFGENKEPSVSIDIQYNGPSAIVSSDICPVVFVFDYQDNIADTLKLNCVLQKKNSEPNEFVTVIRLEKLDSRKARLDFILEVLYEEDMNLIHLSIQELIEKLSKG